MEPAEWYRLGDGYLGLQSAHLGFRDGFAQLFGGCKAAEPDPAPGVVLRCVVTTPPSGDISLIRFEDPEPLDVVAFATAIFAERGCCEVPMAERGQRAFGLVANRQPVVVACSHDTLVASNSRTWEWLVGNIAVHRLIRLQRNVLVLHAASVVIHGRGMLLVGSKGSGKTTLALALAARGHGLLGDEMAALRLGSRELLPMRRSVSVRAGPRSARVEAALQAAGLPEQRFPDGSVRIRARIDQLFAGSVGRPAPLAAVVFLGTVGPAVRSERLQIERAHLKQLTPLRSTLWTMPAGERAVRLLGLLARTRCYRVDAGEPDQTADRLEELALDSWD